jgi:hypothetical protein
MAKKTVKQPPHLRVRIDPKLIARLEKARDGNGRTLTGEIVSRLEGSFLIEDKIELFKEGQVKLEAAYEKRFEEIRRTTAEMEEKRKSLEEERKAARAENERIRQDAADLERSFQAEINRLQGELKFGMGGEAIVDALLGDDPAAREAIRAIALLLANNPGWAASADGVHKITQGITAAINTAAAKSATTGGPE